MMKRLSIEALSESVKQSKDERKRIVRMLKIG